MSKGTEADIYSLSTTQEGEIHDMPSSSDETTALLGAGTRTSHNASPPGPDSDAGASPPADDGWDGFKEFEHQPWYYRPSVWTRHDTLKRSNSEPHSSDYAWFRSIGSSRHMPSSPWHLAVQ